MKKMLKNNRGMTLAVVIIIFAVVAIVGTTVLTISLSQNTSSVASEDTTAAYYYSRSAIDIVSTDIKAKYKTIADAQVVIDQLSASGTATQAQIDAAMAAYNTAVTQFNALRLIPPTTADTYSVQVGSILAQPLTVNINLLSSGIIQLSCEATYEGDTSSARAQIGTFTMQTASQVFYMNTSVDTTWLGDDAFYSWGNINLDSGNFTMHSSTPSQGTISAQGTITQENGFSDKSSPPAPKTSGVSHDMPILVAPTEPDKTGTSLAGTKTLTSSNNGYYGPLWSIGKNGSVSGVTVNWTVNTSGGDVVLVFDAFYTSGSSTINVIGSGNLYIYVKEPYHNPFITNNLINISNHTTILTNSGYTNPQIYFIVYNDVMQWYHEIHRPGSTMMPAAEALALSPSDFDTVIVDNLNNISAFFYLPGCSFSNTNNGDLYGAVYASDIYVKNNKNIYYYPFEDVDLFDHAGATVGGTTTTPYTVTYTAYIPAYNRVWIR